MQRWNECKVKALLLVTGRTPKESTVNYHSDFWTGTLNGMRSCMASRNILITHLISHCTSFAPGGAPAFLCVCVCVRGEWGSVCVTEKAWWREDICSNHRNDFVHYSECKHKWERPGERNVCQSLRRVFLSHCLPLSSSHLPEHFVNSAGSQAWWITSLTIRISFSWYCAEIDFSGVSM